MLPSAFTFHKIIFFLYAQRTRAKEKKRQVPGPIY